MSTLLCQALELSEVKVNKTETKPATPTVFMADLTFENENESCPSPI